ncbi:hypothetical protein MKW94_002344 [Papaver nudicaule]|uniref:Cullin N-terminal domain-containing protein n=1 Tax=Papaver nudicaule TaxID=74823 RepID=A0AA41RU59_PAPNU|nr:hypothetical protein [Papaver nudicaule]
MDGRQIVMLAEGWEVIQSGITKLINTLEGVPEESPMDRELYSRLHTTIYNMCSQKPPHDYSEALYHRYEAVYNDYLKSKVLPAIQEKQQDGVCMLQELVKRWANHKVMVTKLCRYFNYLDRYYIARRGIPTLKDVGIGCFREVDVVISLINRERDGEEIDQTLLKNVLEIFVEIGNENDKKNMEYYVNDFETAFLNDTKDYYTQKASSWSQEEYAVKADECLQREKDRVSHYLHSSTEEKLLKIVQDVLNAAPTNA